MTQTTFSIWSAADPENPLECQVFFVLKKKSRISASAELFIYRRAATERRGGSFKIHHQILVVGRGESGRDRELKSKLMTGPAGTPTVDQFEDVL